MRARLNQVHRRSQSFFDVIATSSNRNTLWFASTIISLLLHCAFISFYIRLHNSENSGNIVTGPPEITLELYSPPDGSTAMLDSPQSDDVAVKDMKANSPVSPQLTSSEAEYPKDAGAAYADTFTPFEDAQEKSKKKNFLDKAVNFESAENPTHKAADTAISQKQAESVQIREQRIRSTWEKQLVTHLARHRSYPRGAANLNAQVTLSFVLDRSGHIVSTTIVKTSGEANIDEAALTMMHRSDPVPPPPPSVADKSLTFTLPIVFSKNTRRELPRKY